MRWGKMGELGWMTLALLRACSSAGAGRAARLSPRANSCATPPGNPVESDGLFPEQMREWQAFRASSHSPYPRPLRVDLYQVPGKLRRSVRPYLHTLPVPPPNRFNPTSASCRHLRVTLHDTRRLRSSASIR